MLTLTFETFFHTCNEKHDLILKPMGNAKDKAGVKTGLFFDIKCYLNYIQDKLKLRIHIR